VFNNNKIVNYESYINVESIYNKDKEVFLTFLGYDPIIGKRFKSPFRTDTKPGCRFEYKGDKLYFVDNAGYKGKIFFDCIETVRALNPQLSYVDVLNLIRKKVGLKHVKIPYKERIIYNYEPIIKFKYSPWNINNYFTDRYGIIPEYLNKQPYYNADKYWTNSKLDRSLKSNKYGFPCIAYYFEDTDHTKLYLPNARDNEVKWYSTCNNNDIFGWHRVFEYMVNGGDLYLLSGAKDEMILNYELGLNTLAFQSETFPSDLNKLDKFIPIKFIELLQYFDNLYIWLDNDDKGIQSSEILQGYFNNYINTIIIKQNYYNDVADISENEKFLLKKIIKNEF
jgi:hypothetical protein